MHKIYIYAELTRTGALSTLVSQSMQTCILVKSIVMSNSLMHMSRIVTGTYGIGIGMQNGGGLLAVNTE